MDSVAVECSVACGETVICYNLILESCPTYSGTDRWGKPFSYIYVSCYTCLAVSTFTPPGVDTCADTDKPVVTEAVGLI